MSDPVSHPSHYTSHPSGIECIEVVRHMSFPLGSAVKYIWRVDDKGDDIENLRKAIQNIEFEIETRERAREAEGARVTEELRRQAEEERLGSIQKIRDRGIPEPVEPLHGWSTDLNDDGSWTEVEDLGYTTDEGIFAQRDLKPYQDAINDSIARLAEATAVPPGLIWRDPDLPTRKATEEVLQKLQASKPLWLNFEQGEIPGPPFAQPDINVGGHVYQTIRMTNAYDDLGAGINLSLDDLTPDHGIVDHYESAALDVWVAPEPLPLDKVFVVATSGRTSPPQAMETSINRIADALETTLGAWKRRWIGPIPR